MSSRRRTPSASMAKAAMPLDELDQWLGGRADRQPAATNLSMLDGYVTAIVAGPVSFDPREWICPLLAIDADAFNHGATPEFAAISAVGVRHNDISNILSTAPDRFEPIYRRKPNRDIDARPWCRGFYAAMQLQMSAWAPLLNTDDINYGLLLPIFAHCVDDQGHPLLGPTGKGPEGKAFLRKAYTDIPAAVEAMRQYWMPTRYRRGA
jgi:uncharacterized protein